MTLKLSTVFTTSNRGTPRTAFIGLVLFFLAGFADGAMMPFFALWAQKEAGIDTQYIGLLLACYAGGELLATPVVGGIADRVGRRPVLLVSTAGVGSGFLLLYLAPGIMAAALSLILIGIFESVLHPTILTIFADTVAADRLRHQFALARVVSNAGHIAGPAIGALLALRSLGTVFLGCGGALLLGALIVATFLPETWEKGKVGEGGQDDDEESLAGLLPAFRDRRLAALLLWFMLLQISGSWIEAVLPLYAHNSGALSSSEVGLLFTYGAALIVVFQLLVTKVLSGVSGFWLVLASGLVLVTGFAILLVSQSIPALILSVTLFSIAQMLFGPLIPTTVNELAPPNARATYMAAASVVNDLKDTVGPASGTFLYAASASLPWLVGMPIALCAAIALAFTTRRHERASLAIPPACSGNQNGSAAEI
jgi:MFS family permease